MIDRLNQEIGAVEHGSALPAYTIKRPIFGIVGIVKLLAGHYLVIITKCSRAGTVNGQDIWKIDETQILPFAKSILHLNEEQV